MANEERVRVNFQNGFIDDNPLLIGAGTLTSSALANFPVITNRQHAALTLDPRQEFGLAEIVWVIDHPAASITATILRGRESSASRQHTQGVRWSHSMTDLDLDNAKNYASRMYARSMWR